MRTRTKQLFRVALVSLSLAAAAAVAPRTAKAEADLFGIGDGHSGAFTAVGAVSINAYAPLTADAAANATTVMYAGTIGNLTPPIGVAAGFAVGDLVMLWRATGVPSNAPEVASGNQARVNLASNTVAGGRVGAFEFARVMAVSATTLTLTKPLVNAWAKDVTQIVRVPEYTTVSVPGGTSVDAVPWQPVGTGFAGGIVAFLASGAVTVAGTVNANAAGFRGGRKDQNTDVRANCMGADGTEPNGFADKGEGVVTGVYGGGVNGGRGNRANGAGGGNCAENGGGGGGAFGSGGVGGNIVVVGGMGAGLGGAGLDYSLLSRFTMGGGGGAGEQKNTVGSAGGIGGGMIFIRARSVAGTGTFTANGADGANAPLLNTASDGAGGGGGGGSIVIRVVENVTCTTATTRGGKGGDTAVAAIGVFGAGGGGGGGRVLIQAASSANCTTNVTPGAGGISGSAGAAGAGIVGQPEALPAPGGNYCFTNAPTDIQCANPNPVCDPTTGFCNKCTGPFGGGSAGACNVAVMPVCLINGTCNPCNGDLGTVATQACQLGTAPYCFLTGGTAGSCGKCTTNADCAGMHAGTNCAPGVGACGAPCVDDTNCKGSEWCSQMVCVPKTPNAQPLPTVTPIEGECTVEKGKRVCVSTVCEVDDDLCGLKNGSPCDGANEKCRSTVCFPGDKKCGKPTGEPCAMAGECRSNECTMNVCTGCDDDSDCKTTQVCDKDKKACVDGCREVAGKSNCIPPKECSKKDGTIGQCIDGAGDGGVDGGDGGTGDSGLPSDAGLVEGGGCACRTTMPISGSPLALAAAALGALLLARRRNAREKRENRSKTDNHDPNER